MESFGQYLKSLREEKGGTLEEISENTKIAVSNLDFLEKDRYDLLPPRVFVKGFVRSYAKELEIDPDECLIKFEEYTRQGELEEISDDDLQIFQQTPKTIPLIRNRWFTIILSVAGLLSLCVLIATGVTRFFLENGGNVSRNNDSKAIKSGEPAGLNSRISKEASSDRNAISVGARDGTGKKILEIRALSTAWVRVEPDGGAAEDVIMAPGDVQVFTAQNGFSVQTGNAGGLRLKFEGKDMPVLGKTNQTLSINLP
jgi:cytoskeleton protein RodZ